MNKVLLLAITTILFLLISWQAAAQKDQFAYAITDASKEGTSWKVLRKIDLKTGSYSNILLDGLDAKAVMLDAATNREITPNDRLSHLPFHTGVAAIALDKNRNRLFFTPMYIHQLRYIDLHTMKVYAISGPLVDGDPEKKDAGKTFSRMTITPDGTGYAISNDANHLIQFTTDKKPSVKQLGNLVDAPANKTISIHNSCTSYGGDIVCDDKGTLYLISGLNHVFSIDPKTKVATHLATIKGLPPQFTTSAAVVHTNGQILISSASGSFSSYLVHPKSWQATAYGSTAYHTSDLANSNYIITKPGSAFAAEPVKADPSVAAHAIQVYPNPVVDNTSFTIQFSNTISGHYIIQLIDLNGQTVFSRRVHLSAKNSTQTIPLAPLHANGIYLVRVVNAAKKSVFEQKLMIH